MPRQRPVGEVHRIRALVVEFDERLGRVGTELVDFNGENIANFFCRGIGVFAGGAVPGSVGYQVAVEGRLAGGDVEGRAYAGAGCNRLGERRCTGGDGSPAFGCVEAQFDADRRLVRAVGKGDRYGGRGAGRKGLHTGGRVDRRRRRQAYGLHGILCRNDVRLDQLVGGVCREGVGSGDGALVERALRADAVIAAVAEQNGALLAHGVIAGIDARPIEHDLQGALLRVTAHRGPVVRLTFGHPGDKARGHIGQARAELGPVPFVHAAYKIVLLVGHHPRAGWVAVIPRRGSAEVGGLHGAGVVVVAVDLGVAVVEAAAAVEVLAADDPVLSLGLVVHGDALGIILAQAHAWLDENAVDLVAHDCDGGHVGDRNIIEATRCRTTKSTARRLGEVIALAGLVIDRHDPAIGVGAEGVLRGGIGISARIRGAGLHNTNVERLAVGLTQHLVKRAIVGRIHRAGAAVGGHAWVAGGSVDVTRAHGTGRGGYCRPDDR